MKLEEVKTKIEEINVKITFLVNQGIQSDTILETLEKEFTSINSLFDEYTNLEDLKSGLVEISNTIKNYTSTENLTTYIKAMNSLSTLYRNLPKPIGWANIQSGLNYWVQGGNFNANGSPYSGRPDGYAQMSSIICK